MPFAAILPIIGYALQLVVLIFKEVSEARARARAKNEKIELNKKLFLEASDKALATMREQARRDHAGRSDVEDEVEDAKGPHEQ
jgi:preprotein translocase subunit SecF